MKAKFTTNGTRSIAMYNGAEYKIQGSQMNGVTRKIMYTIYLLADFNKYANRFEAMKNLESLVVTETDLTAV